MSSKQQSFLSTQICIQSVVFSNIPFKKDEQNLLQTLREKYVGIQKVSQIKFQDDNQNSIDAIKIDLKSVDIAKRFLQDNYILIGDEQYSIQSSTQSLIALQVPSNLICAQLAQDLRHNYLGLEKIVRFYDKDGKPVDIVRLDFKSNSSVTKILNDKYILIDGKRCPVQPFWSLVYHSQQNGNLHIPKTVQNASNKQSEDSWNEQPQNYLTEQRVKELIRIQELELKAMINSFENKWNARLSSLKTTSKNINVDQLLSIFQDLKTVCQQFNQQNNQIQTRLGTMVNRVENITMQSEYEEEWPKLLVQNGH
ncbi:unnamed protein product [Rotaria sp. Silwood1]|nr:unnamed protein product [Rotaria sp. Silwood1]CAF4580666.1 unnamed protein product [Rotaria sp. Silwood1]